MEDMWSVIKVIHYTSFGKSSGYIHTGGSTKLFLFKDGKYRQKHVFGNEQTKYLKGDQYDITGTD